MSDPLDTLYRDVILDHYRSPRGKKKLETPSVHAEGMNPSCGDELTLDLQVEENLIRDVHVSCKGCAISVASASMLAETIKGKSLSEVQTLLIEVTKMLKGEQSALPDDHGDLDVLSGVQKFPVRIKCALLSWMTLAEALRDHANGRQVGRAISTEEESA
jgi:nitrogen fixation NifU-like protein